MPIKLFDKFLITGHRTDLQKKLHRNEKDEYERTQTWPSDLPWRTSKPPPLRISKITAYNRLPTVRAVNSAAEKAPTTTTLNWLKTQLLDHVARHLQSKGLPKLTLLGEHHGTPS